MSWSLVARVKPAIIILAVCAAAFALPFFSAQAMRRAWQYWRIKSRTGTCGAVFAVRILRHGNVLGRGVVEGGRLFHEKYDCAARDVILSREVHDGRSLSALAHAALCAGGVLQDNAGFMPRRRLIWWGRIMRFIVNVLPPVVVFLLFHPASWRSAPFLVLFCFLISAVQVLTFPAVRDAAARARQVILENQLLPPSEMDAFQKALHGASLRHLAAPLLDCFWVGWLL
ncbi:MAG: zinc metallopeptidase [Puniceicoccales bacterium]|nr:zinc metallopeptidase [Puniceicoccales bacterium]